MRTAIHELRFFHGKNQIKLKIIEQITKQNYSFFKVLVKYIRPNLLRTVGLKWTTFMIFQKTYSVHTSHKQSHGRLYKTGLCKKNQQIIRITIRITRTVFCQVSFLFSSQIRFHETQLPSKTL